MDILELLSGNLEFEDIKLKNFTNLSEEEHEIVRRWRNHPEVRKWMYSNHEISREEHLRFVERLREDTKNFYYLVTKEDKNVGVIYLTKLDLKNRNAYLGIYSNPQDKIKGAGLILGRAIMKLAFKVVILHTLKLEVFENNLKALELYKKLGFKKEGRLREFVYREDRWLDVIVMGMTEEEYKDAKDKDSR